MWRRITGTPARRAASFWRARRTSSASELSVTATSSLAERAQSIQRVASQIVVPQIDALHLLGPRVDLPRVPGEVLEHVQHRRDAGLLEAPLEHPAREQL